MEKRGERREERNEMLSRQGDARRGKILDERKEGKEV